MIACKICQRQFKTLNHSHLSVHETTPKEYKKRFGLKYIHSKQARKKIGISKIGNKHTKGKHIKLKPETKEKIKKRLLTYNKLDSTRKIRKVQLTGNNFASGHKHSKAFKKRLRKRIKELWANPAWRAKMLKAMKRD